MKSDAFTNVQTAALQKKEYQKKYTTLCNAFPSYWKCIAPTKKPQQPRIHCIHAIQLEVQAIQGLPNCILDQDMDFNLEKLKRFHEIASMFL